MFSASRGCYPCVASQSSQCPYNPGHVMPSSSLQAHLQRCPDRFSHGTTRSSFNVELRCQQSQKTKTALQKERREANLNRAVSSFRSKATPENLLDVICLDIDASRDTIEGLQFWEPSRHDSAGSGFAIGDDCFRIIPLKHLTTSVLPSLGAHYSARLHASNRHRLLELRRDCVSGECDWRDRCEVLRATLHDLQSMKTEPLLVVCTHPSLCSKLWSILGSRTVVIDAEDSSAPGTFIRHLKLYTILPNGAHQDYVPPLSFDCDVLTHEIFEALQIAGVRFGTWKITESRCPVSHARKHSPAVIEQLGNILADSHAIQVSIHSHVDPQQALHDLAYDTSSETSLLLVPKCAGLGQRYLWKRMDVPNERQVAASSSAADAFACVEELVKALAKTHIHIPAPTLKPELMSQFKRNTTACWPYCEFDSLSAYQLAWAGLLQMYGAQSVLDIQPCSVNDQRTLAMYACASVFRLLIVGETISDHLQHLVNMRRSSQLVHMGLGWGLVRHSSLRSRCAVRMEPSSILEGEGKLPGQPYRFVCTSFVRPLARMCELLRSVLANLAPQGKILVSYIDADLLDEPHRYFKNMTDGSMRVTHANGSEGEYPVVTCTELVAAFECMGLRLVCHGSLADMVSLGVQAASGLGHVSAHDNSIKQHFLEPFFKYTMFTRLTESSSESMLLSDRAMKGRTLDNMLCFCPLEEVRNLIGTSRSHASTLQLCYRPMVLKMRAPFAWSLMLRWSGCEAVLSQFGSRLRSLQLYGADLFTLRTVVPHTPLLEQLCLRLSPASVEWPISLTHFLENLEFMVRGIDGLRVFVISYTNLEDDVYYNHSCELAVQRSIGILSRLNRLEELCLAGLSFVSFDQDFDDSLRSAPNASQVFEALAHGCPSLTKVELQCWVLRESKEIKPSTLPFTFQRLLQVKLHDSRANFYGSDDTMDEIIRIDVTVRFWLTHSSSLKSLHLVNFRMPCHWVDVEQEACFDSLRNAVHDYGLNECLLIDAGASFDPLADDDTACGVVHGSVDIVRFTGSLEDAICQHLGRHSTSDLEDYGFDGYLESDGFSDYEPYF